MKQEKLQNMQTKTLLTHRSQIDIALATRSDMGVDLFTEIHKGCGTLEKERVGWKKVGFNSTWMDYEHAPIKILQCTKHNVKSARFVDMDAYMSGEVGVSQ